MLKGDPVRDLEQGDAQLIEHDQHQWKETETRSATVSASDKSRKLVRGNADSKKFWADPASDDKADETAGNWMQKVDRLRVLEYVPKPPDGRTAVVRVDYRGHRAARLSRGRQDTRRSNPQKSEYWVMTEHTHLYGKVHAGTGEQVEQDVGSVVR